MQCSGRSQSRLSLPIIRTQPTAYHWTDSIAWGNATAANSVQDLLESTIKPDSFVVNQLILQQKMEEMSGSGGGILFFPAGDYFFPDHLVLKSRVVLRGEASIVPDARTAGFEPRTRFGFPKYILGNPRSTAFKEIKTDSNGVSNSGLVNIEVNRAVIGIL
jgi:hypothetical protein